jgi:hypothetical protein
MIRIDFTTSSVTVEGDGHSEHLVSARTLDTPGAVGGVFRGEDADGTVMTEAVRCRTGTYLVQEFDLDEPGAYFILSGRRDRPEQPYRSFGIRVDQPQEDTIRISVGPTGNAAVAWVIEDVLHHHMPNTRFVFDVRISTLGIAQERPDITRLEADQGSATIPEFRRSTAWERLLEDDDDPESGVPS